MLQIAFFPLDLDNFYEQFCCQAIKTKNYNFPSIPVVYEKKISIEYFKIKNCMTVKLGEMFFVQV